MKLHGPPSDPRLREEGTAGCRMGLLHTAQLWQKCSSSKSSKGVISQGTPITCPAHFPNLNLLDFHFCGKPSKKCTVNSRRALRAWFNASKGLQKHMKHLYHQASCGKRSKKSQDVFGSQWWALSPPSKIGLKNVVKFKVFSFFVQIYQNDHSSAFQKYPGFDIFRPFNINYNHFKNDILKKTPCTSTCEIRR